MKIGIVQGRLTDSEKLQSFPKDWRREYNISVILGFSYIESFLINDEFNKKFLNKKNLNFIKKKNFNTMKSNQIIICDNYSINSNFFSNRILQYYRNIFKILDKKFKKKKLIIPINDKYFDDLKLLSNQLKKIQNNTDKYTSISLEANVNPTKINSLFKLIRNENIGFTFDTGNIFNSGYNITKYYNSIKNHIDHVHIKDRDQNRNNVSLGSGLINFKDILRLIKKNKNISTITLETFRKKNSIIEAYKNLKFIENLL